jgi:hypothetical protein
MLGEVSRNQIAYPLPRILLSSGAEWAAAKGQPAVIRLEEVRIDDPRIKGWHKEGVPSRETTPSLEPGWRGALLGMSL